MFDTHYDFKTIMSRDPREGEHFQKEHKLTFSCKKNQRYIVNVEEYLHDIYIIKFHLKSHSDSEDKYRILTHFNDAAKIISTCTEIMISFYKNNDKASFGFIGAQFVGDEDQSNTKRFRVYRRVMENLFSPVKFSHYSIPEKSAYLLLNKLNTSVTLEEIERMFNNYYRV